MITETYRYPDRGDRVTTLFIEQHEPYPGYWESSERRALGQLGTRLAAGLDARGDVRALDAGCGEGRLLPWIAGFSAEITAVDPDVERLAVAQTVAVPENAEVTFRPSPITGLSGGPFDVVICSHVIQHVPTADLVPILENLYAVSAPGGWLALSFSRAPVGRGGFSLDRIEQGGVRPERVGRHAFDRALGCEHEPATLPVRHVDPQELAIEASNAGWQPVWDWTYHVLEDLGVVDEYVDRDELVNGSPPLRRDLGRDIVTLWRRAR